MPESQVPASWHWSRAGQTTGVPGAQLPPAQTSSSVQRSPSSQASVLSTWPQPVSGSQISVVQTSVSSQVGGVAPVQLPPLQTSTVVHALSSSHGSVLLV